MTGPVPPWEEMDDRHVPEEVLAVVRAAAFEAFLNALDAVEDWHDYERVAQEVARRLEAATDENGPPRSSLFGLMSELVEDAVAGSMSELDALTADAKILSFLLRHGLPEPAWQVANATGLDPAYVERTLVRWADDPDDCEHPILRRRDLGPDVYEAVEDSAREGDPGAGLEELP
jgi:hypothetical protein